MIVDGFDSKAFETPTEKMSNTIGLQTVCARLQEYMLAMARSAKNIADSSFTDEDKAQACIESAIELTADYNQQLEIFADWIDEDTLIKVNQIMETLVLQTVPMSLDERVDFLENPSLFIDYRNCDLEDIARQHGPEVAQFARGLKLQYEQQQMQNEINALIHGGSASASEQQNFIQLTQTHEDELLLKKKVI